MYIVNAQDNTCIDTWLIILFPESKEIWAQRVRPYHRLFSADDILIKKVHVYEILFQPVPLFSKTFNLKA